MTCKESLCFNMDYFTRPKTIKKRKRVAMNNIKKICYITGFLLLLPYQAMAVSTTSLSISEAERLAIIRAPEINELQANTSALQEDAIADKQLPDPQLMLGAINVPTNTFSFSQDEMTMTQIGLAQSFPAGHSRAIKSQQIETLAQAESAKTRAQTITLLQNVRNAWLDLYYWLHAQQIIQTNRELFSYLLQVTESRYSAGKGNESDVLQVQLELSHLDDQLIQIQQQIEVSRDQLARWVGESAADELLSSSLPHWQSPPSLSVLQNNLIRHPLLQADSATIEAARQQIAYEKQQYKPTWTVSADYGVRQAQMMNGSKFPDMVGAQVTMNLPIFTHNRQDRRLQASIDRYQSAQFQRDVQYKNLDRELQTQYDIWQQLSKRENLFTQQLIPEAKINSKAALLAYQSATTDLTDVLRAYISNLNIQLEQLQVRTEKTKSHAALFYLQGQ